MNSRNTVVIMTLVAGVILVQLVSRGQPETGTAEETKTEIKNEVNSNRIRIGNLLANVPDTWRGIRPSSSMRLREFRLGVAADDATLAIFKNIGGTIDNNLERWSGQFGYSLSDSEVNIRAENINGMQVSIISILGTYTNTMVFSNATQPKPNYRLLGAIADTPDGLYYFKLTGPNTMIIGRTEEFTRFIQSLRYDEIG
jgi:hypothetical protein